MTCGRSPQPASAITVIVAIATSRRRIMICLPEAAQVGLRVAEAFVPLALFQDARRRSPSPTPPRLCRDSPLARDRYRPAHLGACGQLAFRKTIAPVLFEFFVRHVFLGPARAERAFVHLAAHAERAGLRKLRRAERTRIEAIAAADAEILVVQHDAFFALVEA